MNTTSRQAYPTERRFDDDNDENFVVDVCGTDDIDEAGCCAASVSRADDAPPSSGSIKRAYSNSTTTSGEKSATKSPGRKYCLTASFSRMSPFKTVKVGDSQMMNSHGEGIKAPVRRNLLASFKKESSISPKIEPPLTPSPLPPLSTGISTSTDHKLTQPRVLLLPTRRLLSVNQATNSSVNASENFNSTELPTEITDTTFTLLGENTESEAESCFVMPSTGSGQATSSEVNNGDTERRSKAPRKEKSLGNLCKRFLLTMGELAANSQANDVHLESVAKRMKVEKRRIYDIVNVMEALEAMSKTNKSFYKWRGLAALPQLMHSLQREAISAKFPEKIRQVGEAMCNFMDLSAVRRDFGGLSSLTRSAGTADSEVRLQRIPSNSSLCGSAKDESLLSQGSTNDSSWADTSSCFGGVSFDGDYSVSDTSNERYIGANCGKNSLVHLCRRFLMMLLCDPEKRFVSLDVLSTVLIKDPTCEDFTPPDRSRCRRLYDIANVLEAMELIKKVPGHFGTKKIPLFEYCGPEPDASPLNAELSMRRFLDRIGLSAIDGGLTLTLQSNVSKAKESTITKSSNFKSTRQLNNIKNENQRRQLNCGPTTDSSVITSASKAINRLTHPVLTSRCSSGNVSTSSTSPMQYLSDMAEFMRTRLHHTASTNALSLQPSTASSNLWKSSSASFPVLTDASEANKENQPPGMLATSRAPPQHAPTKFGSCSLLTPRLLTSGDRENDLPKPKAINPLVPSNKLISLTQQTRGVTAMPSTNVASTPSPITDANVAAAMTELLKGMLPVQPTSSLFASDLSGSASTNLNNQLSPFIDHLRNSQDVSQNVENTTRPKMTHSVSSILGVSQSENINGANNASIGSGLTASPKAFKPFGQSNRHNRNFTSTPLWQQQNFDNR